MGNKCFARVSCTRDARWGVQGRIRGVVACSTHLNWSQRWVGKLGGPVKTWKLAIFEDEPKQLELDLGSTDAHGDSNS